MIIDAICIIIIAVLIAMAVCVLFDKEIGFNCKDCGKKNNKDYSTFCKNDWERSILKKQKKG